MNFVVKSCWSLRFQTVEQPCHVLLPTDGLCDPYGFGLFWFLFIVNHPAAICLLLTNQRRNATPS